MADLVFKNGKVVTVNEVLHGGVVVDGGKIVAVDFDAHLPKGKETIDLGGKILFPGIFDPHIHWGLGNEISDAAMRTDFEKESRDAILGGLTLISTTTLIGQKPLTEYFARAVENGEGHSNTDFSINAVVNTIEQTQDIPAVAAQGAAFFKHFTGYRGEQAQGFGMAYDGITPALFYQSCRKLAEAGPPAFAAIHAEDPWVRDMLGQVLAKSGRKDVLSAWAETTRPYGESIQLYVYAHIAHEFDVPIYPVHVSRAHTVDLIDELLGKGINVIGETVTAFLCTTCTELDAKGYTFQGKIQPPIPYEEDKERLWAGIQEGTIKIVGTDSLRYTRAFKEGAGDFWKQRVGLNNQTRFTLSLMYDEGVRKGRIDLVTLGRVLATNAAKAFGLYPKKGAIQPGADADLVILDPNRKEKLGMKWVRGGCDYSMWEGREVTGWPVATYLRGKLMAKDNEVVADKFVGTFVKP